MTERDERDRMAEPPKLSWELKLAIILFLVAVIVTLIFLLVFVAGGGLLLD